MPVCFSCGAENVPLFDVGCVNADVKACGKCVGKHSKEDLKNAADKALQYLFTPAGRMFLLEQSPVCRHCGEALLTDAEGRAPLICRECVGRWRAECA